MIKPSLNAFMKFVYDCKGICFLNNDFIKLGTKNAAELFSNVFSFVLHKTSNF